MEERKAPLWQPVICVGAKFPEVLIIITVVILIRLLLYLWRIDTSLSIVCCAKAPFFSLEKPINA